MALYEACNEYKKLKPWEVLFPETMIVIKDEVSSELAYCMVLGNEGPHFGLNVYLGEKGLVNYLDLILSEDCGYSEPQIFKTTFSQQGYMLSFIDRGDLIKEDYDGIKALGLSYRGKKQWPMFRRWYPGSRLWLFEDEADAILLTRVVWKIIEIIKNIMENKLVVGEDDFILSDNQQIKCVPGECILDDENRRPYVVNYQDDLKIHQIKKLRKLGQPLEVLQLMMPNQTWIDEVNRSVFPILTVVADSLSGYVFNQQLNTGYDKAYQNLNDYLADFILNQLKYRPNEIIVNEDFIEDSILDFCTKVGIECKIGPTLTAEEFVSTMLGIIDDEEAFTDEDEEDFIEKLACEMDELTDSLLEAMMESNIIKQRSTD